MQLLEQILNGITLGSIYALIAIGYTMVYGVIGMINFAHGEVYMVGAFVGLIVMTILSSIGASLVPVYLIAMLLIAILVSSVLGWSIERVAYRPLRGKHRLIPLISAIGMSFFLQNFMQLSQGPRPFAVKQLIPGSFTVSESFSISYMQILIPVVTLVFMVLFTYFISKTKLGVACRATEQDRRMANLLGINTDTIISVIFVIGASLAAVAGVLVSLYYGTVRDTMGFIIGIKAFTAAVLGGIGSIPGAMLGGFVLGFTESFASAYIGGDYKDIVSFVLLLLILLVLPSGLLGKAEIEKV
ncbi:MAG: branched-chain amino acid ABC transporter permease LivH [Gammaproteobacteria bacterium]|nr:MAG: branched-chain amino acid ABC transporter permease LivH [Gammaproteobacteria bacterium]